MATGLPHYLPQSISLTTSGPLPGGYKRRHQSIAFPAYKWGTQIRYSLSLLPYLKTLLNSLFEHSILVEAEN